MKRPSRQGAIQLGMTKQRFILLQTDRLLWFKKGDQNDCILGEIPITPQTELYRFGLGFGLGLELGFGSGIGLDRDHLVPVP